jgi:hypothetical protein
MPELVVVWTASSGATAYDIYRDGSLYSQGQPSGTLRFFDIGAKLSLGATHSYFVRARNSAGTRDSNSVTATAPSECVAPAPDDSATFVSETFPDNTRVNPGQHFVKTWTLRNSGRTTWDRTYSLKYQGGDAICRHEPLLVDGPIGNGRTFTFSVDCTAPTAPAPASYVETWALVGPQGGRINIDGAPFAGYVDVVVQVNSPPPGPFTLRGIADCINTSPRVVLNWTASSGAIAYDIYKVRGLYATVPAGTLSFEDTTNQILGFGYPYFIRARNLSGTTDSNIVTPDAPKTCGSGDAVTLVSKSLPDNSQITRGQSYTQTFTLRNTGTTTWNSAYSLQYSSGNSGCVHGPLTVNAGAAPNASVNFSLTCTAPAAAGNYLEEWRFVGTSGIVSISGGNSIGAISVLIRVP